MSKLFRFARLFIVVVLLFAFSSVAFAQGDEASAEVDVTAVIIGAFVTVGVMALGAVYVAVSSGKSVSEAARAGGESAVRGIITNKEISAWGEARLNYVPTSIRKALLSIVDVFDPATASSTSDLDDKTLDWIRNLADGDPNTGAVTFEDKSQ